MVESLWAEESMHRSNQRRKVSRHRQHWRHMICKVHYTDRSKMRKYNMAGCVPNYYNICRSTGFSHGVLA